MITSVYVVIQVTTTLFLSIGAVVVCHLDDHVCLCGHPGDYNIVSVDWCGCSLSPG